MAQRAVLSHEVEGEAYERPASRLRWRRRGDEYFGGDYTVALVEAHCWEVFFRGYHESFQPTRAAALERAENHHREVVRTRDLRRLGFIAVVSLSAVIAMYSVDSPGVWVLPMQLAIASLAFVGLTAIAMFQATFFRNKRDPYRRREPWERQPGPVERLLRG